MSLKVIFPNRFTKRVNRIARKHPSIIEEIRQLKEQLSLGDYPGDRLQGVGARVYKVRLVKAARAEGIGLRIMLDLKKSRSLAFA